MPQTGAGGGREEAIMKGFPGEETPELSLKVEYVGVNHEEKRP